MKKWLFLFLISWTGTALAQTTVTTVTSADIYLQLRKLNVLGSVLYVAAHPDDENTRLLTYLSKDRLYRTGYLSLTRGDGGQNLIGDEQGIELGLIRTQELLSARRIDGAEQFFSRAYDFGFSKNPEETFTKWDREKVLSDVVWMIRKFQPDVIVTRFPTTGEGGHGHHTASAILANEAFTAAADPKRFPEQLSAVRPWQAKRILWNTFNFGGNNTTRPDQFRVDVGGYNPVLGKSYGEIASESRSQHKSQGFGVARSRGEALEFFNTTGGTAPVNDLFDGVATDWSRVPGGQKIAASVQAIVGSFDFLQPQKSVPALVQLYKDLQSLEPGYWKTKKEEEVQSLIALCSGIWMEAVTSVPDAVRGDSLRVSFGLNNRGGADVKLQKITLNGFDTSLQAPLGTNRNFGFGKALPVPSDYPVSQPYWLKEKMERGMFVVKEQGLIGQPDITPAFTAEFHLLVNGAAFTFSRPVQYKYTDPVKGEIYQPLFVVHPLSIQATPDVLVFQKDKPGTKEVTVLLGANRRLDPGPLNLEMRSATYYDAKKEPVFSLEKGNAQSYTFDISNKNLGASGVDNLKSVGHFTVNGEKKDAYHAMAGIRYDHIPAIRYFYADDVRLLNIDLKTSGKKIGYITGAGDRVPATLEQMGYEVTMLSDKDLARLNLQVFDAIITGVRAYNTNDWLNSHHARLMKYVENGGNLIVQYNTSNQIGPVRAKIGPYNFTISRTRVTDEEAAVTFLNPAHPVLNFPNKIGPEDFRGWVQERSIYHASGWDKNFEPVLGMSDPGETSDNGSLIIARHGKGYFTYTGLVFFRELPAGVPGAYRLMANLIALNRKKEF